VSSLWEAKVTPLLCGDSRHGPEDELRDWCERELDTSSFDGMYGARERVIEKAVELGLDVTVRWRTVEVPHPSGTPTGGGTRPDLLIEDAS
jgi:hypothetical protein